METDWLRESSDKQLFVSTFWGAQLFVSSLYPNGLTYICGSKYIEDQILRQTRGRTGCCLVELQVP